MPTNVRFVSNNQHKIDEARSILGGHGIAVLPISLKIAELQTTDTKQLVHDKLLKAFEKVGRPLFVEHTGLYVLNAHGLPGGLTQIFWDSLEADSFSRLFSAIGGEPSPTVAKTWVSYCDGRRITDFEGEIEGAIVSPPRGPRDFQWDCVFQPDGSNETFAEMGAKKNEISMRRVALDKLAKHIAGGL